MAMLLPAAAVRTYDALKRHPRATPRKSDAKDDAVVEALLRRLNELIASYRLSIHPHENGRSYVFWSDIQPLISSGAFDDMLDKL